MKITPSLALPGLATALALILAVEWLLPGPGASRLPRLPAVPSALSGNMADEAISQWAGISLARPLFEPDRRPPAAPGSTASTSLPRLSAIMIIGGERLAIFTPDGQKSQVVAVNGTISGYRVERISPGTVELSGPEGDLTVRPQFQSPAAANAAGNGSAFDDEVPMNAP